MRFVMPYILKWALKAFVKRTIQNGTFTHMRDANAYRPAAEPQPEGKVKVDYIPKTPEPKPKEFRGGEYVDYEEVK